MSKIKMPPEDYRKVLKGLDIISISLLESSAKIDRQNFPDNPEIKPSLKSDYELKANGFIDIISSFSFKVLPGIKNKKSPLDIKIKYLLQHKLDDDLEFTDEFFNVYKIGSVEMMIWPYIREHIQSILSQMGLTNLTLPMRKLI